MFSFFEIIKNIFQPSADLSKLKKVIFGAVGESLQHADADLWNKQLAAVNKIHRSPDGCEINLYAVHGGRSDFPKEICFPKLDEFKIAVVDLSSAGNTSKLRGRVWCVNGHVFSIEFKTSFKEFEENASGEWQVKCHIKNQRLNNSVWMIFLLKSKNGGFCLRSVFWSEFFCRFSCHLRLLHDQALNSTAKPNRKIWVFLLVLVWKGHWILINGLMVGK